MADTAGRIPLWIIGIVTNTLVIDLVGIFFYGYFGESLKRILSGYIESTAMWLGNLSFLKFVLSISAG